MQNAKRKMQNVKKAVAVVLSVLLILASFPISAFALTSGDFEYSLTPEGGALITGYTGESVDVAIPETVITNNNQYEVQSVNMDIFDSVNVERISIPKTVVVLENVFHLNRYHKSLREITVDEENANYSSQNGILFDKEKKTLYSYPNASTGAIYTVANTVETIFTCAFYGASNLRGVTLGNSVTSLGVSAFAECSKLAAISLNTKLDSIEANAFNGCESLLTINIPQSVSSIGLAAFRNCLKLTAITVSNLNEDYASENGVLFSLTENGIKTQLIAYPAAKSDEEYKIPETVLVAASYSFFGAKNLKSIEMGTALLDIRSYAFSDCPVLKSVSLGATVSNIGECAFLNCPSFKNIRIGRSVNSIGNHALGYYYLEDTDEYKLYDDFSITTPANTAAYQYAYNNHITLVTDGDCAHTYSYVYDIVSPTCTEQGYTEYACTYCGEHFRRTYVEPLGHSEGEWIVDKKATYTSTGKRHKECDRCRQITTTETVPMLKRSISSCKITLSSNSITETGKAIKPTVTVTYDGKKLRQGKDYTVSYSKNTAPGIAKVTVKGIGEHYKSSKTLSFKIKPKKITGFKVSKKSATSVTLKWNTRSNVNGYKIYMLNTKTNKYELVKTLRGAKKKSVTISKTPTGATLKNKKTYKFKICAYKIVDSETTVNGDKTALTYKK
ncbi:MAG: leucine-rich repeat protein [Eubacterium sp.]|nr:leucine-rich repeat protein [Eubacterium sp.]